MFHGDDFRHQRGRPEVVKAGLGCGFGDGDYPRLERGDDFQTGLLTDRQQSQASLHKPIDEALEERRD